MSSEIVIKLHFFVNIGSAKAFYQQEPVALWRLAIKFHRVGIY
jgi:hypothetical protein